jgi:hypothetical protein
MEIRPGKRRIHTFFSEECGFKNAGFALDEAMEDTGWA